MSYFVHSDEDRRQMLNAISVTSVEDLFSDIPSELRFRGRLDIPEKMPEQDVLSYISKLARLNADPDEWISFVGGGLYDRYVPAGVYSTILRSEYLTCYTPYQAEVSQGTLQTIFEYQTIIANLTGMDVANAGMYDAATALAEAAMAAVDLTGKKRIVISSTVHPWAVKVVETHIRELGCELVTVPYADADGITATAELQASCQGAACVCIQQPNFFGCIEPGDEIGKITESTGAMLIVSADPLSLAILKPPAEYGAHFVVGEGQGIGFDIGYGGPLGGFFATRKQYIRRMPGRLAALTNDAQGRQGFCLALQTREQFIRREKATSNICTSQSLYALATLVYSVLLGKEGLKKLANTVVQRNHYLLEESVKVPMFSRRFSAPIFQEFVLRSEIPVELCFSQMENHKIMPGIPLGQFYPELEDCFLVCATERRSRKDLDAFIAVLKEAKTNDKS